ALLMRGGAEGGKSCCVVSRSRHSVGHCDRSLRACSSASCAAASFSEAGRRAPSACCAAMYGTGWTRALFAARLFALARKGFIVVFGHPPECQLEAHYDR